MSESLSCLWLYTQRNKSKTERQKYFKNTSDNEFFIRKGTLSLTATKIPKKPSKSVSIIFTSIQSST